MDNPAAVTAAPQAVTRWAVHAAGAVLLIAGYIALDWASYIYPLGPFNITPWNPPLALVIVWIMLGGIGYAPVVFIAALAADILIRGMPGGIWISVLTSAVLAVGYSAIAGVLRRLHGPEARLHDVKSLWIFVAITAIGTALVALLYVGVLRAAGFVGVDSFVTAAFRFWIGDVVGVLVTAPLLLVSADARLRAQMLGSWRLPETALQFAVMAVAVSCIFYLAADPSQYFYVLFLPLIWIALRGGLSGAVLASALVQVGVVLGAHVSEMSALAVVEMQALLAALTLTGLFLGMMVDERERAAEDLRRSMQLAAAGEMAGAIAHELNQPLAALANYASACSLLLERNDDAAARRLLSDTVVKMHGEAMRAGDVVARLRDFFRSGTTRLEATPVALLLDSARRLGAQIAPATGAAFDVVAHGGNPGLLIDRLQIELVLRNLLANAFEAAAQGPAGAGRVSVAAEVLEGELQLRITDSGPGVPAAVRERLFEPFVTGKSTGMGLGLAICQAVVKAHGGSLTAGRADHGEFILSLPCGGTDEQR